GPGAPRPWRDWAAFPRPRARRGPHARHGNRPGIGTRAPSAAPREGPGGRRRGAESLRRWGTPAPRPPGRAGAAGPHEWLARPPGEPLRSPTAPPPLPRRAAPAAHEPDRVCTPRAQLRDETGPREA